MSGSLGAKSTNTDVYTWFGRSGGNWGTASNWLDTTQGNIPSPFVPGTLTPVVIAAPNKSAVSVITGGGSAASVVASGNVSVSGSYLVGGTFSVGAAVAGPTSVSYSSGTFALDASSSLAAGTVALISGTLSVAVGSRLAANGGITIGSAPVRSRTATGLVADSGAVGTLNLAAGASLSAGGAVSLAQGTLTVAGATASLASSFTIGVAATPSTPASTIYGSTGTLAVTGGGTLTVGGALTVNAGIVVVAGAGSRLVSSNTLTASIGGLYSGTIGGSALPSAYSGLLTAANGGVVQLGGLVLNAPIAGSSLVTPQYLPNISVDATAAIEIGTLGNATSGALTIDAGKSISAATSANINGNVVDNGTIIVTAGTLAIEGNLSGSGTLQIGRNATLRLDGTATAGDTIAFTDTAAVLSIGASPGSFNPLTGIATPGAPYGIAATISGMRAGDSILLSQTVTGATYTATTAGRGTLTLSNGSTILESLALTGIAPGGNFLVSPTTGGSIVRLQSAPAQTSSAHGAASIASGISVMAAPGRVGGESPAALNSQAATALATVVQNEGSGTTTLKITGGGTVILGAAITHATVKLDTATNLTLSRMGFVTALGSAGDDTITALAAGQTLTGGAGVDALIGSSGFGDTFSDTAAGLNGDQIQMFGGSDLIDITDLKLPHTPLSYTATGAGGTLRLTDGIQTTSIRLLGSFAASRFHMAADGHGGTQVTYA